MSFSMMTFNLVQSQPRWEQVRRRQLAGGGRAHVSRDTHHGQPDAHSYGLPSHATRIVGKVCFSCHSVSTVRHKFCEHCGAPLFRPADSENPRPIVLNNITP